MTRALGLVALLFALSCASISPANRAIDWSDEKAWSFHIVTLDSDDAPRVTRVWFVVDAGAGAIRTGDSRWWANIERGSDVWVRSRGVDYPVRIEVVTDSTARRKIDAKFLQKYGWQEDLLQPENRYESADHYMRLSAR